MAERGTRWTERRLWPAEVKFFLAGDGREKGAIEAEGWRGGEFVGAGRAGFGDG